MKITNLEVDGFGVWTGLKLDALSHGINVFYGPNEAGKTTLMQFVRAVLYGFSPARRRYLPPVRGGSPGGSLHVTGPNGPVQIRRYLDQPGESGTDRMELVGPDGAQQGGHLFQALLAGVDELTFNNVFAVGLRELQELGTLCDTDAASMLYSLSVGLDRVSLVNVVRELNGSRNRILASEGGTCEIDELVAKRDKLRSELEEIATLGRRYGRLATDQEQLDREAKRLEKEINDLRHRTQVADVALAVHDRWRKRAELDQRLDAIGPTDASPERALEQIEGINDRLRKHQAFMDELRRGWESLRAERSRLEVNEALWKLAPRIEVLAEQVEWIGTLQKRVSELESEISGLEDRLNQEKRRFGMQDALSNRAVQSVSPNAVAALKQPAKALRQAQRFLAEAQQQADARAETAQQLDDEIRSSLELRGETDLATAIERVGGLVARLRRRDQTGERVDQMHQYRSDLEEQSQRLLDDRVLPAWMLLGLGAVFITGMVVLLMRLFVPAAIGGGWPLTVMAIMAMVGAMVARFLLERSAAHRLDGYHHQLHTLDGEIRNARMERDTLQRQLPEDSEPAESRIRAAESDLAALEELVPLDARRRVADEEAKAGAERVREAEAEVAAGHQRWRDVLATLGLPKNLSPRQVKGLVSGSDEIVDLGRRLEVRYEELQQRSRELESFSGRIKQITQDAGLTLDSPDPVEQLQLLIELVGEQETRLDHRRELRNQARLLRGKRVKHEKSVRQLQTRRREVLQSACVKDEQALRDLAAKAARARELREERESIQRELQAALAGHGTEDDLAEAFEQHPGDRLPVHRREIAKKLASKEAKQQALFQKRGEMSQQLKTLVEERGPAAKRLDLATIEKRLEMAVERWQTLALTSHILASVRSNYEQDRQPETLREASGFLEQMTQGRYTRVWTPLDRDILFVDNADGKSLSVEVLSQGLREQLFVALRLAMVSAFARRGTHLPLILDDVLVNFDNRRAQAAAALLREFADGGHQVLVFTCHEHIATIFRSLDVHVTDLPIGEEVQARVRSTANTIKKRRKKKRKPKLLRKQPEEIQSEKIRPEKPEPEVVEKPEPEPELVVESQPEPVIPKAEESKTEEPVTTWTGEYAIGSPLKVNSGFLLWEEDVELPAASVKEDAQEVTEHEPDDLLEFVDEDPPIAEPEPVATDYQLAPIEDEELELVPETVTELGFADEEPLAVEPPAIDDEYKLAPIEEEDTPERHPQYATQHHQSPEPHLEQDPDDWEGEWSERYGPVGEAAA